MRWRLVAAFVGVLVLVLLAQDVPLAAHLRRVEDDRLTAELQRDAFVLAGTSEDALSGDGNPGAAIGDLQATADLYHARSAANVVITDRDGIGVAVAGDTTGSGAGVGEDYTNRPEIATALTGSTADGRRPSVDLGEDLVFVAVPVLSGADIVGAVRVAYPASRADARADAKVRGLVLVGAISLSAAVVAALFMAGSVVRPVRRLQRATEQVAAGEFDVRAATDEGPPEVRRLATSFNAMTERIAGLVEQQRAFAGDASHQLRTPLTALRIQLERAADVVGDDPQAARDLVEAAGHETERLQHMVDGLLLLSRGDRGRPAAVPVDASSIVAERAELWRSLAAEHGVEVAAHVPVGVAARAVPGAVEQIVDNLLDNAIRVVAPGSTVEVVLGRAGDRVEVHVLDRGPGMTGEQLAHAFDRFWRAPDAPHEGSGLGLAIVRHLAEASGGTVDLTARVGGGLDAALRLPAG